MRRGGLWVCSSAWCEMGVMRILYKSALRACGEIKERAYVHFLNNLTPGQDRRGWIIENRIQDSYLR